MIEGKKYSKQKVIFVTGSAGFIGSNLVLKLLKENENIHITVSII